MAQNNIFRVLPHDGGWKVKRDGNARASAVEETKPAALTAARTMAGNARGTGTVIVHRRDGTVQESRRYE